MSVHHRVWKVGADVDTDQLAPGAYMKLGILDIAKHCLEGVFVGLFMFQTSGVKIT